MSSRALNEEQFGDYTLTHLRAHMDYPRHQIIASTSTGYPVGHMNWHPRTHEITGLWVDEGERRQGIATAIWQMGQRASPRPVHSADRTRAGDAWARAVGGRLPRRKVVYDPITKREV